MSTEILYVANCRMPTERAHGLQIAKMCGALAALGARITLVVPRRVNHIHENLFSFYGVPHIFNVHYIPCLDLLSHVRGRLLKFIAFKLEALTFGCFAFCQYARSKATVFTRDQFSGFLLSLAGNRVYFEIHDQPRETFFMRLFMRRIAGLVTTNKWKGDAVARIFSLPRERVFVAPNAVDVNSFDQISQQDARRRLGLSPDKKLVLYAGHLFRWKGVYTLAESVRYLAPEMLLIFVGGTEEGRAAFEKFINENLFELKGSICVVGFRPHEEIPLWLAAADVVVLPTSAKEQIGRVETSPLKLFEYMAAHRPIVATDVPAHREVVSEAEVCFVAPDDPNSLARGIETTVRESAHTNERLARAAELVNNFTWESRAEKILEFINYATFNHHPRI